MSLCLVCSQSATVWCSNDAAFLCNKCDVSIHTSNAVASRHTRVPVCSLCNSKASSVYCVQDRAALCDDCDTEIHASNPLPHDVIPVHMMNKIHSPLKVEVDECHGETTHNCCHEESHLEQHPSPCNSEAVVPLFQSQQSLAEVDLQQKQQSFDGGYKVSWEKDMDVLGLDNAWLDQLDVGFDFSDILGADASNSDDAMVPSMSSGLNPLMDDDFMVPDFSPIDDSRHEQDSLKRAFRQMGGDSPEMERSSYQAQYSCPPAFVPTCASLPSFAVRATALAPPVRVITNQPAAVVYAPSFVMPQPLVHVSSMQAAINREQRVLRYREKRRNRKFEKTIRYASRKAYAEVRPRIKGRFAKKEELGSGSNMWEQEVGVVPQFSF